MAQLEKISDGSPVNPPYVGPAGVQYPPNIADAFSDAQLEALGWRRRAAGPVDLAPAIKAEATRRIWAVINDNAQKNTSAAAAAGWPDEPDEAARAEAQSAFVSGVQWVAAMRGICRALIDAQDVSFADDVHWPACPAPAAALAARF
jgi:hypothetical protein